jgi:hypothetical protein
MLLSLPLPVACEARRLAALLLLVVLVVVERV